MENKPILYGDEVSPPVRFVMITAAILKTDLEFRQIDLFKAENKSDFFTKINPLQKVPALAVGGETICDSHAITMYLCQESEDQNLYPEDAMLRAKINEMIFFNSGTLFTIDSSIYGDYFAGKRQINKELVGKWHSALNYMEAKLDQNPWLSGDKMRLSDICCATTISTLECLLPVLGTYVKLNNWMKKIEELPAFQINKDGLKRLKSFIDMMNPN
ncbi:hypothetical protein K1T71_010513 [Dendrolimus kikuchii]|uniref:Uncharacterized protein n=1 Tax=Dendrolimus kikuchii TaxID=765133 RepID=A0ACC1CSW1_9NEOP|nr:hypothetical protein K1T71_010513 [Dendrolimus kikuchii]